MEVGKKVKKAVKNYLGREETRDINVKKLQVIKLSHITRDRGVEGRGKSKDQLDASGPARKVTMKAISPAHVPSGSAPHHKPLAPGQKNQAFLKPLVHKPNS